MMEVGTITILQNSCFKDVTPKLNVSKLQNINIVIIHFNSLSDYCVVGGGGPPDAGGGSPPCGGAVNPGLGPPGGYAPGGGGPPAGGYPPGYPPGAG